MKRRAISALMPAPDNRVQLVTRVDPALKKQVKREMKKFRWKWVDFVEASMRRFLEEQGKRRRAA